MRRILALSLLGSLAAATLSADVSIVERRQLHAKSSSVGKTKVEHGRRANPPGRATGSQALIDTQGLKYFINTNITFSTSISASDAMSEVLHPRRERHDDGRRHHLLDAQRRLRRLQHPLPLPQQQRRHLEDGLAVSWGRFTRRGQWRRCPAAAAADRKLLPQPSGQL